MIHYVSYFGGQVAVPISQIFYFAILRNRIFAIIGTTAESMTSR